MSALIIDAEQLTGSENAEDHDSSPSANFESGDVNPIAYAAKSDAPDGLIHDIVNAGANLYSAASLLIKGGGFNLSKCLGRAGEGLQPVGSWASQPLLDSLIDDATVKPERGNNNELGRLSNDSSTAAAASSSNERVANNKRQKAKAGKA